LCSVHEMAVTTIEGTGGHCARVDVFRYP
jgi:hypothetical protein